MKQMIACSQDLLKALNSPIKELYLKIEFYDSKMKYISEFSKQLTKDDLGSISIDANRPIRRNFSFTLNNQKNEFGWGENNLIWIDKRVKIYIGLKLSNGNVEYIPQGVFIMSEPEDSHTIDGKRTTITGQDKAWLMTDKRGTFDTETTILAGGNIGTTIKTLASKVKETMFNFDSITEIVPYTLTYQTSDSIYKAIEELALLAKCIVYYDEFGYLRLRKIDLNEFDQLPAVWSYKYGDPSERFYAGSVRRMDETNLANDVVVLGGSGQTAVSSYRITVDNNATLWKNSPYSIQKIGRITYFHNDGKPDPLLTTNDECKWRAKFELMNRLGYTEKLSLQISPNWLHDANDVIEVIDNENLVNGKYLIQNFSLPLNPDLMTIECLKYRQVIENWDFI